MSSPRATFVLLVVAALLLSAAPVPVRGQDEPQTEPPAAAGTDAASSIAWKSFGPAAFRRAAAEGRLVLLVLDVPWSDSVARADATVWNHPDVVGLIRDSYIPIRERADLRPDLRRRYPAEGWPAVSILLPDGTALVFDTSDENARRRVTSGFRPASSMAELLQGAAAHFRVARARAIDNARKHLQTIRETSRPEASVLSETMVWGIGRRLHTTFDPERRYFGGPPRIPRFELLELMLTLAGETRSPWEESGLAAVDTLYRNLVDEQDGGLQRLALGLDWEQPQSEKLLDRNARLLDVLALAHRIQARKTIRERGMRTASFILDKLGTDGPPLVNGLCSSCPGGRDEVVLTGSNAVTAAALIRAGTSFGDEDLVDRGLALASWLRQTRYRPGRLVPHAIVDGRTYLPGNFLLDDQASVVHAFITAYEVTGDAPWLDAAADLALTSLSNLRDGDFKALADVIPQPDGPQPLRFGLFPLAANAQMARGLVRLHHLTGNRRFHVAAREILGTLAGSYENSQLQQSAFGLAVYDFHEPPIVVHVVGDRSSEAASAMRRAALGSPFPYTVVRSWSSEEGAAALKALGAEVRGGVEAHAFRDDVTSGSVRSSDGLGALVFGLREQHHAEMKRRAQEERAAQGGS